MILDSAFAFFDFGRPMGSVNKFCTSNRFRLRTSVGNLPPKMRYTSNRPHNARTFRPNRISLNLYIAVAILAKENKVAKERKEKSARHHPKILV